MSPRQLFRVLAVTEAVTWSLLLAGMAQKYLFDAGEWGVSVAGAVHGFAFLAFVVTVLLVAVNQRWRPWVTFVALVSAVPPLATIPAEWWLERSGRLEGDWRRTAPEDGASLVDRVLRGVLARPALAAVASVVVVGAVFAGLLVVGPPGGGSGAAG